MWYCLFMVLCLHGADDLSSSSFTGNPPTGEIVISLQDYQEHTPTREIAEIMISHFFDGNGESIRERLRPYLERKLESTKRKSKLIRVKNIPSGDSPDRIDGDIAKFITRKVSKAMEEALQEQSDAALRFQNESANRVTKKNVALITSVTSILTALAAAGVTIAVTFGSC